jgi:hypothetical protein
LIAIEPEQNQAYELDRQGQWHLITLNGAHDEYH